MRKETAIAELKKQVNILETAIAGMDNIFQGTIHISIQALTHENPSLIQKLEFAVKEFDHFKEMAKLSKGQDDATAGQEGKKEPSTDTTMPTSKIDVSTNAVPGNSVSTSQFNSPSSQVLSWLGETGGPMPGVSEANWNENQEAEQHSFMPFPSSTQSEMSNPIEGHNIVMSSFTPKSEDWSQASRQLSPSLTLEEANSMRNFDTASLMPEFSGNMNAFFNNISKPLHRSSEDSPIIPMPTDSLLMSLEAEMSDPRSIYRTAEDESIILPPPRLQLPSTNVASAFYSTRDQDELRKIAAMLLSGEIKSAVPLEKLANSISETIFRRCLLYLLQCYVTYNYKELERVFSKEFCKNEAYNISRIITAVRLGFQYKSYRWFGHIDDDSQFPGYSNPENVEKYFRKAQSVGIKLDKDRFLALVCRHAYNLGNVPRIAYADIQTAIVLSTIF